MRRRRPVEPVIINHTDFRGDDLRRFVRAGIAALEAEGKVQTVEFRVSPGFRTTGYFHTTEKRILINIPRGYRPTDIAELAQVYEHEVDHACGSEHKDMPDWWTLRVTWATGLQMRKKKRAPTRKLVESYERKIRELTLEMDKVWTPRTVEAQVLGSPRRRRRS